MKSWYIIGLSWYKIGVLLFQLSCNPVLVSSWFNIGAFSGKKLCILGEELVYSWCIPGVFLVKHWCISGLGKQWSGVSAPCVV